MDHLEPKAPEPWIEPVIELLAAADTELNGSNGKDGFLAGSNRS
jgi:hypothetical protein